MRYTNNSVGSAYLPKLLGIYERELTECIEEACRLKFPVIIDIGAAEGYYAIGLAIRNPQAKIIAFEMEERGRAALKEMAKLNNVESRLEVHGRCEFQNLESAFKGANR